MRILHQLLWYKPLKINQEIIMLVITKRDHIAQEIIIPVIIKKGLINQEISQKLLVFDVIEKDITLENVPMNKLDNRIILIPESLLKETQTL